MKFPLKAKNELLCCMGFSWKHFPCSSYQRWLVIIDYRREFPRVSGKKEKFVSLIVWERRNFRLNFVWCSFQSTIFSSIHLAKMRKEFSWTICCEFFSLHHQHKDEVYNDGVKICMLFYIVWILLQGLSHPWKAFKHWKWEKNYSTHNLRTSDWKFLNENYFHSNLTVIFSKLFYEFILAPLAGRFLETWDRKCQRLEIYSTWSIREMNLN